MLCSRARTALSARLDGEALPPGAAAPRLDAHLAGCAECRAWEARAVELAARVGREVAGGEAGAASADRLLERLRGGTADGGGAR